LNFLTHTDETYKDINLGLIFDYELNALRHNGIKKLLKNSLVDEAWSLIKR